MERRLTPEQVKILQIARARQDLAVVRERNRVRQLLHGNTHEPSDSSKGSVSSAYHPESHLAFELRITSLRPSRQLKGSFVVAQEAIS